jgi:hypothetical protein
MKVIFKYMQARLGKPTKNPSVPAKVQTEHLPNLRLERCRYTSLLDLL